MNINICEFNVALIILTVMEEIQIETSLMMCNNFCCPTDMLDDKFQESSPKSQYFWTNPSVILIPECSEPALVSPDARED